MTSDAALLDTIRQAFSGCHKPGHFTDRSHCEECRDHDDLLRARDIETLRIEDVGNPGWDPLCHASAEGFAYLFPALARLVLAKPTYSFDWYLSQLLFHLTDDGASNRHLRYLGSDQRKAVTSLLLHISDTRPDLIAECGCADELQCAIELWTK